MIVHLFPFIFLPFFHFPESRMSIFMICLQNRQTLFVTWKSIMLCLTTRLCSWHPAHMLNLSAHKWCFKPNQVGVTDYLYWSSHYKEYRYSFALLHPSHLIASKHFIYNSGQLCAINTSFDVWTFWFCSTWCNVFSRQGVKLCMVFPYGNF